MTTSAPRSIYERFGVQPVINASGSVTRLGGAPMPPEVLEAFCAAAGSAVSLDQLQAAASERIAVAAQTEAGLVTSGSAAALTLGTAAILTGYDLGRMEQLPHCGSFPDEFVIAREQRSGYDHAVRAAGARLVEVGFNELVANAGVRRCEPWEYEAAFGPNTAGVVYVMSDEAHPAVTDVVEVAHRHDLPVNVDAAGELPPRSNLSATAAKGADLMAFSGGKAIRGPQSTGILCGRRDLIGAAALQMIDMDDHFDLWDPPAGLFHKADLPGIPRHGIGRGLKVSKEEVVALLVALELFQSTGYSTQRARQRGDLELIQRQLDDQSARCEIQDPTDGERTPILVIEPVAPSKSARQICLALRRGRPPIYLGHGQLDAGQLVVNPLCLDPGQAQIIARRLQEELAG